jgi:hypothetical protein
MGCVRETRSAYLDHLAELGQIPLKTNPDDARKIVERLRSHGRSDAEIQRIIGIRRFSLDETVL